ncbi:GGDEF domain-containing protein [Massilia consociata]|uniref:diguanylate cyclase n=1 Tax=Massilia consociata TaxID=760117 RepID=A0ABV6FAT8_9BURK
MLMLAIGNVTYAILMAGYYRAGSPEASMKVWTWAKLVEGLAFFAFWLRPEVPPVLGTFLSNGLLIAAAVGETLAYCMFLGYRWERGLLALAIAGELLLAGAIVAGVPGSGMAVLMSLLIASIAGLNALIMIGTGPRFSLLRCIIGAPNLLIALAFYWRAWVAFTGGTPTVFTPSPAQTMIYVGAYFLLIVNGFGFLLLCKQKDEQRLRELATTDSLTGLANRYAFLGEAERAHSLARRLRQPVSLMMVDIDHFKKLNDRYGHAVGDAALRVFAQAAQSRLRAHDVLGRLGGEEFAVLMPATGLHDALEVAERLRVAVAAAALDAGGEPYGMTVSIGVAELAPDEAVSAALQRADKALYAAKRQGRNRVEAGASDITLIPNMVLHTREI